MAHGPRATGNLAFRCRRAKRRCGPRTMGMASCWLEHPAPRALPLATRSSQRRYRAPAPPPKKNRYPFSSHLGLTETRSAAEPLKRSGSSLLHSIWILRIWDIFRIILAPKSRL
jgi:hypothetical protein